MKGKALYLYCMREKSPHLPVPSMKGIDGKGKVFSLPFRQLEAIVSNLSLKEFATDQIQKKAQEDLGWIKEKAVIHERVIEEAMRKDGKIISVVPMRFGTIFRNKTKLEESLDKDYPKIKQALERARDNQEWSVKVYLENERKLRQKVKARNAVIKEKQEEMDSLPEGMAFFVEEEIGGLISKEVGKELNIQLDNLFEDLKSHAAESVKNKILTKELTGRKEPMVLNAAYLIPENKVEPFKEKAATLNRKIRQTGLYLEYSGPWPAFNFATLENER